MRRRWGVAILALAAVAVLTGCGSKRSTGVARIEPTEASPGTTLRVVAAKPVFREPMPAVRVGIEAATVLQVLQPTEAFVLVPNLPPGVVDVAIAEEKRTAGPAAKLRIEESSTRQLVVELSGDSVRLVASSARAGELTNTRERDRERIAFDVLTADGHLVYGGAVVDPALMEVFDEPRPGEQVMRQEAPHGHATLALQIPNLTGATTVRFYRVAAGVDLESAEGRRSRRLLTELRVTR